jgi:hypothetical protein
VLFADPNSWNKAGGAVAVRLELFDDDDRLDRLFASCAAKMPPLSSKYPCDNEVRSRAGATQA